MKIRIVSMKSSAGGDVSILFQEGNPDSQDGENMTLANYYQHISAVLRWQDHLYYTGFDPFYIVHCSLMIDLR